MSDTIHMKCVRERCSSGALVGNFDAAEIILAAGILNCDLGRCNMNAMMG